MNLENLFGVFQTGTPSAASTHAANDRLVISANHSKPHLKGEHPVPVVSPNLGTPAFGQCTSAQLVTCQSCEHLTANGQCQAKAGYKPMPDAKRHCNRHQSLQEPREPVADAPYCPDELATLLERYEDQLLSHLAICRDCRASDRRWCDKGFAVGSAYDALLLCFKDESARRQALNDKLIVGRMKQR